METPDLVDAAELARMLGVKLSTVRAWTSEKRIPFRKFGRSVRYEPAKVLELWQEVSPDGSLPKED